MRGKIPRVNLKNHFNARCLGGSPAGGVDCVAAGPVLDVLPLCSEGDGILARPAQHLLCHHTAAGHRAHRQAPRHPRHRPAVQVHVVTVQVVGDVAPQPRPSLSEISALRAETAVSPSSKQTSTPERL